jgi:hypothetical protein
MTVQHYQFTVNPSTPTELTGILSTGKRNGLTIVLNSDKNNNVALFIGDSTVTNSNFGYHMDADQTLTLSGFFDATDRLYAVCASGGAGSAILHVLVVGK